MNIQVLPIQEQWIKDLTYLSDLFLGKDYLTSSYFENVIDNDRFSGLCAFENEKIIAFLIFYKTYNNKVIEKLEDKSLYEKLDKSIVCLDTMVVAKESRRKGIGKMLVSSVINNHKKNAGFIMYTWKQNEAINMEKIANYFSFNQLSEYPKLWKEACENNDFKCPVKIDDYQKCICSCMLYYRKQAI